MVKGTSSGSNPSPQVGKAKTVGATIRPNADPGTKAVTDIINNQEDAPALEKITNLNFDALPAGNAQLTQELNNFLGEVLTALSGMASIANIEGLIDYEGYNRQVTQAHVLKSLKANGISADNANRYITSICMIFLKRGNNVSKIIRKTNATGANLIYTLLSNTGLYNNAKIRLSHVCLAFEDHCVAAAFFMHKIRAIGLSDDDDEPNIFKLPCSVSILPRYKNLMCQAFWRQYALAGVLSEERSEAENYEYAGRFFELGWNVENGWTDQKKARVYLAFVSDRPKGNTFNWNARYAEEGANYHIPPSFNVGNDRVMALNDCNIDILKAAAS